MADQTPVAPKASLLTRTAQAVAYAISGVGPENWMGPMQPLNPMADGSKGRAFDYPVAFNLNYIPRANEPLSFVKLKALAEVGIVRTLIQTRQDQLSSLDWTVRLKEEKQGKRPSSSEGPQAGKIKEIHKFLESPDKRLGWHQWLHQLLEQHFVYDGVAVYKQRTRAKQPYSWIVIDAATISIKIDADGRPHPPPPSPAYQQVLKGLPTSNYTASVEEGPQFTTGDMLYVARNTRVDRAYGFPIVAQILNYVEMTLARAKEQLGEFTQGNSPRGVMVAPEGLQPDQIKAIQNWWDSLFTGNLEQRRRLWWVAAGSDYKDIPRDELFGDFDEWLARVCCFAFSISPTPFVKRINRATAESAQEVAASEGLQPLMKFVARVINRLIQQEFQTPDIEFAWVEDDEFDPSKKAVIDVAYAEKSIRTIDEIRDSLGEDPFGGVFSKPMAWTATGWVPADPVEAQAMKPVPTVMGPDGKPVPAPNNAAPGAKPSPFGAKKPIVPNTSNPQPKALPTPGDKKPVAKSLTIERPLLNAYEVQAWAKSQGLDPVNDMRLVQCYTRDHHVWADLPSAPNSLVYAEGGDRAVEKRDDEIVLRLENDDLSARHIELMSKGVGDDETFAPYIVISHKGAASLAEIDAYHGPLLLGEEAWSPVKDDWLALVEKMSASEIDEAAHTADANPSQAQIEAGNYRHGHIDMQGLKISIENPKGGTRSGIAPDGTPWTATLPTHYGYIKRTQGADGEHVDVYVGPNPNSQNVWIIDQVHHATGDWDEHKVFIGYDNFAQAQQDYLGAFSDGQGHLRIGGVAHMPITEFKSWLDTGDTTKPVAMKSVTIGTGLSAYDQQSVPSRVRRPGSFNFDPRQETRLQPLYAFKVARGALRKVYHSVGELPPAVRDKLKSPRQRRQWMHVWNSTYARTKDEGRAFASAWSAVGKRATIRDKEMPDTGYVFYEVTDPEQEATDPEPTEVVHVDLIDEDNQDDVYGDPMVDPNTEVLDGLLPESEVGKQAGRPFAGRVTKYDPDEPRDEQGQWTTGGGGGSTGGGDKAHAATALYEAHADIPSHADFMAKQTPEARAAIEQTTARLQNSVSTSASVSEGGFRNPDGSYTAEREALHDQIIDRITSDKAMIAAQPREGEKPTYTMLGGRGGSGKSNLTSGSGPLADHKAVVLDNDWIKSQLPGYEGWNAALYHDEASHVFARADSALRAAGVNVVHDATMRTEGTAKGYIKAYKDAGYEINGYYMFAPPQVAAQRAVDRFMNPAHAGGGRTGRFVPPSYVLDSVTNERTFDTVKDSMTHWAVYSSIAGPNGSFGVKLVASK